MMLQPIEITSLRKVKRTAVIILLIFRLNRPVTAREVADILEMDYETTRKRMHEMASCGWLGRTNRTEWILAAGARSFFNLVDPSNAEKPRLMDPSSTTTPIVEITEMSVEVEEKRETKRGKIAFEIPKRGKTALNQESVPAEILKVYREVGITINKRTRQLATQEHINPDYIRGHWEILTKSGKPWPGLLITILESQEPLPVKHNARDDYRKYIEGEFAPFINY